MDLNKPALPTDNAWKALRPGTDDSVYLIAPSSRAEKGTVAYAEKLFTGMGFKVAHSPDISRPYHNWGNTAKQRAEQIIAALHDPRIKAIYALEGGEGACEVVAELKKREAELRKAPNRGIPLIGFSNITYLHHYLGEHGIVTPVQGPSFFSLTDNRQPVLYEKEALREVDLSGFPKEEAASKMAVWEKEGSLVSRPRNEKDAQTHQQNAARLRSFLIQAPSARAPVALQSLNGKARAPQILEGTLAGGCDLITQLSRYTTHGPDCLLHPAPEKPILLLESKTLKDLEDTLSAMKESGDLPRHQAIVLGKYTGNPDKAHPDFPAHQLMEMLKKLGIQDAMPVFHGGAFGHGPRGAEMQPLALYTPAAIEVKDGKAAMTIAPCGTKAGLDRQAALKPIPSANRSKITPALKQNDLRFDQTWVALINQLHAQEMAGQNVLLHFPFDAEKLANPSATINPVHMILMSLAMAGKLQAAASLTIAADGEFTPEFKAWLSEFTQTHLPGLAVHVANQRTGQSQASAHCEESWLDSIPRLLGMEGARR